MHSFVRGRRSVAAHRAASGRGVNRSVLLGVALVVAGVSLMAGCGSDSGGAVPDGPYKAQIVQAQRQATSDFQREVLSDGKITKAEYDEAVHRFVQCMADKGVTVTPHDNGGGYYGYAVPPDQSKRFQNLQGSCAKGTTALIADLYIQMLTNPSGGDISDAVAACLVRKGLVDKTFTGEKLRRLHAADPRGKNLPYDPQDPEAIACETNPQQ